MLSGKCKTRKITLKYYKVAAAIWSIIEGKRELEFMLCVLARVLVKARGQHPVSSSLFPHYFQLSWLASEAQGSFCLPLSSAGVQTCTFMPSFSPGVLVWMFVQ